MKNLIKAWSLWVLLVPGAAVAQELDGSHQLIVVTSKNWDAIQGIAQRYERHATGLKSSKPRFRWCSGRMAWVGAKA